MKVTKVKVPIYFSVIQIVVAKDLNKALRKLKINENGKDHEAFVVYDEDKIILFISKDASQGLIAHESVHIVNLIFKNAHVELDIDNDEPQAYLMGWVVEEITKAIKKS